MRKVNRVMNKTLLVSLVCGLISSIAHSGYIVDQDKWVLLDQGSKNYFSRKGINSASYNKPFEISILTGFDKDFNTDLLNPVSFYKTDYLVDCKNHYYEDLKSTEFLVVNNKLKTNYVRDRLKEIKPSERYKIRQSFTPDAPIAKDICSLSSDYKKTTFKNDTQVGWTPIVVKQVINYLSDSDLKYKSLTQPFLLKVKSYKTLDDGGSVVTTGLIDCKNLRAVPIKTQNFKNDYEYGIGSKNAKLDYEKVHEKDINHIPEKNWSKMSSGTENGLITICKK